MSQKPDSNENDFDLAKLRPGQSLLCRIQAAEPGGYLVQLLPSAVPGFLPSQDPLPIGRDVPATFVCMDRGRALLAFAFMIGTTERVQLSTDPDSEQAFAVWADSYPRSFRQRRAVDLVMPPLDGKFDQKGVTTNDDASKLIQHIEQENLSGCLKCSSEEDLSRAAVVFYKGRAVGATYGSRSQHESYPTDLALKASLRGMLKAGTNYELYRLPDEIVLSLSAVFLGCPIEEFNPESVKGDLPSLLSFFNENDETACITISLGEKITFALSFVHSGAYVGSYYVERQLFAPGPDIAPDLTANYPECKLEAAFLPKQMTSNAVLFGYSLAVALKDAKKG